MNDSVIRFAQNLVNHNYIDIKVNSLYDLSVQFFETLIRKLCPKHECLSEDVSLRYLSILNWISSELETDIRHISVQALIELDSWHLKNLLEIFWLLLDEHEIKSSVEFKQNITACLSENDWEQETDEVDSNIENQLPPEEVFLQERLAYLKEKLKHISKIALTDDLKSPTPIAQNGNIETLHVKNHLLPVAHKSVLKPIVVPLSKQTILTNFRRTSNDGKKLNSPDKDLLGSLLECFPGIELSQTTRNYMRLKLDKFYRSHTYDGKPWEATGLQDTFARKLSELEKRQHGRLALLQKEERQAERIRCIQEQEACNRQMRTESKEKKRQTVRSRWYYRQHSIAFRAQKLAVKAEEERIFRKVFEEGLQLERRNLLEERQVAREVREKEATLREVMLSDLEYAHIERVKMMKKEQTEIQEQIVHTCKQDRLTKQQIKLELRRQLESNIRKLEEALLQNTDSLHFRERDGVRFIRERIF